MIKAGDRVKILDYMVELTEVLSHKGHIVCVRFDHEKDHGLAWIKEIIPGDPVELKPYILDNSWSRGFIRYMA